MMDRRAILLIIGMEVLGRCSQSVASISAWRGRRLCIVKDAGSAIFRTMPLWLFGSYDGSLVVVPSSPGTIGGVCILTRADNMS
jgi:hypothetical protein